MRISYKSFDIELRDSYKFINKPLKDFSKTFGLSEDLKKKDAIAYGFYNYKNYRLSIHDIDKYKSHLEDKDKTNFDEIMKKDGNLFDYDEKIKHLMLLNIMNTTSNNSNTIVEF